VLPLAIRTQRFDWTDGPVTLEIATNRTDLISVKRTRSPERDRPLPAETVGSLDCLGDARLLFADTYAAAIAAAGNPLSLGPVRDVQQDSVLLARRVTPPAVLSTLATVAFLLSPLGDVAAARRAQESLRQLEASEEWRVSQDVQAQFDQVTGVLTELDQFISSREELTSLLAEIARRLPERTALERLTIQGTESQLTAVGAHPLDVIGAVRRIPAVAATELIGEITREANNAELQRITLKVRMRPRASSGRVHP
jgi:hypothetical protein